MGHDLSTSDFRGLSKDEQAAERRELANEASHLASNGNGKKRVVWTPRSSACNDFAGRSGHGTVGLLCRPEWKRRHDRRSAVTHGVALEDPEEG
jgi:hypothetical protein